MSLEAFHYPPGRLHTGQLCVQMLRTDGDYKTSFIKSSWTPLNDHVLNSKVFEDRRTLLISWFSKWSEHQRKRVICDLIPLCTRSQIEYFEDILRKRVPTYNVDFTRIFPRVLTIYLFSFLDPRSLCRCAQVCWYWKYLADSNEIWAPKCLHRGWSLPCAVDGSAPGVWKRRYIQSIRYMQVAWPMKVAATKLLEKLEQVERISKQELDWCRESVKNEKMARLQQQRVEAEITQKKQLENRAVWRAPDRHPTETRRMNYFDDHFNLSGNRNNKTRRSTSCSLLRMSLGNELPRRPLTSTDKKIHKPHTPTNPNLTAIRISNPPKVNLMAMGPQVPWRPNSYFPQRIPPTDNTELTDNCTMAPNTCRHHRQQRRRVEHPGCAGSSKGARTVSAKGQLNAHGNFAIRKCESAKQNDSSSLTENCNEPRVLTLPPPSPAYPKQVAQAPLDDASEITRGERDKGIENMKATRNGLTQFGSVDNTLFGLSCTPEPKPRRGLFRDAAYGFELQDIAVTNTV